MSVGARRCATPNQCSLEDFDDLISNTSGADLRQLNKGDLVFIRTMNSLYRIEILDPASNQVTIQGGSFFSLPTSALLRGSSKGGAILKMGWIGVGLQMEIVLSQKCDPTQSIVTSPIESFYLERGLMP